MSETYYFAYQGGTGEIVEKKSRFIATVAPVASEEEALRFIEQTKKQYWDARHNCTAFTLGSRHQLTRCSDDGEPAGTAGRPMLDVLLKEDIHNVAVVVTRYFGGYAVRHRRPGAGLFQSRAGPVWPRPSSWSARPASGWRSPQITAIWGKFST